MQIAFGKKKKKKPIAKDFGCNSSIFFLLDKPNQAPPAISQGRMTPGDES